MNDSFQSNLPKNTVKRNVVLKNRTLVPNKGGRSSSGIGISYNQAIPDLGVKSSAIKIEKSKEIWETP